MAQLKMNSIFPLDVNVLLIKQRSWATGFLWSLADRRTPGEHRGHIQIESWMIRSRMLCCGYCLPYRPPGMRMHKSEAQDTRSEQTKGLECAKFCGPGGMWWVSSKTKQLYKALVPCVTVLDGNQPSMQEPGLTVKTRFSTSPWLTPHVPTYNV